MKKNGFLLLLIIVGSNSLTAQTVDTLMRGELREVVISAELRSRKIDRDVYTVNRKMAAVHPSAFDLLKFLPGAHYNPIADEFSLNRKTNIVYLIDGLEKTKEEVRNLSSTHVRRIEVVHSPGGKYASFGTDYVLDFVTRDYEGIDLNFRNFSILSPFRGQRG